MEVLATGGDMLLGESRLGQHGRLTCVSVFSAWKVHLARWCCGCAAQRCFAVPSCHPADSSMQSECRWR